jgi:hypothetical protein
MIASHPQAALGGMMVLLVGMQSAIAVPPSYSRVLAALQVKTSVPILLPTQFPVSERIYGDLDYAAQGTYTVDLDYTSTCHGAAVCTFGRISGTKLGLGARRPLGTPVRLTRGITGYYVAEDHAENCNTGYCFSRLTWDYQDSRYALRLKSANLADSVKTANSALNFVKPR